MNDVPSFTGSWRWRQAVCAGLAVMLGLLPSALRAYVLESSSWPLNAPIVLNLQLGTPSAPLLDGSTSWNDVALAAMNVWNPYLGNSVQLQADYSVFTPAPGDRKNSVFFSSTIYGESFGSDTLAVTTISSKQDVTTEADVQVNSAQVFDSYRGPLRSGNAGTIYDLRRVLIHEFGHVLGLDHTPQDSQSIMTPVITDIDTAQADDIAGVADLYGTPGNVPIILNALNLAVVANQPFAYQFIAAAASTYEASGLPPGLSLNQSSGVLSGTTTTRGVFAVTLVASNRFGAVSSALTITVEAPPVITSALNVTAVVGQPFSYSITATDAPTGFGTLYGPTCDPATGVIVYTPTDAGKISFQISATNVAGTASATLTITSVYDFNSVTLHQFTQYEGSGNFGSLIQATDGNFYGTSSMGGGTPYQSTGFGSIYRMSPNGTVTVLQTFTGSNGSRPSDLIQARDGNLYGTIGGNGDSSKGAVFKITMAGEFSILHNFVAGEGSPSQGVVEGKDGNLYGTTGSYTDVVGSGSIYRVALDGTMTTLHVLNSDFSEGLGLSALVSGADGNLYGTTDDSGPPDSLGTIFRCTPDGTFTTIHAFPFADTSRASGRIIQSTDGNLYGVTYNFYNPGTNLYRCTLDGQFTRLNLVASVGTIWPGKITQGSDGALYTVGAFQYSNGIAQSGIVRCAMDGTATLLHQFGKLYGSNDGTAVTQAADGALYGVYVPSGGLDAAGVAFKVAPDLSALPGGRSGFFLGETALSNGVFYLVPRGSNNPFGYYAYLSDPRFIYHFDLGYEYWFDAADGKNGIYFYDFKSGSFFYTSPSFPFPYLYDFTLNSVLYYYPDPNNPGRYNTNGTRYFYNFATGQTITK